MEDISISHNSFLSKSGEIWIDEGGTIGKYEKMAMHL